MSKRDELRQDENVGRIGVMGTLGALATLAVSAGIAVIQNAIKTKAEQAWNENTGKRK